jgi:release factor glutamine methyltransferase
VTTIADLRRGAEARLRELGVDDPSSEARFLLEEVSGLDPSAQVVEADRRVSRRAEQALTDLLDRRADGEPLQYVLGSWDFCGHDLLVDRRVLIPRPETEIVAQHAIAEVERLGERVGRADPWGGALTHYAVADLGTGSGALALALAAALPDAEVWATDVDDDALAVARANVSGAGTTGARVRIAAGSWFGALPESLRGSLLLAVANPPYIADDEELPPIVRDWEPGGALFAGPTGLEAIEALVAGAPEWLDPAGTLVLELAPHQTTAARELAEDVGFREVKVRHDLTGRERVLVARRRADA